jgi:NDP-sugar pyrophosphorylase family protein
MIQSYFEHAETGHKVTLIWEESPTGTAGSLHHAVHYIQSSDFFVSNCDILLNADYSDIYDFHLAHDNDITIVASVQHLSVPYGVLQMKNEGLLQKIVEKPEYDFLVNTGFYVINKKVINHIPKNQAFDFPNLIEHVQETKGKVRIYPVGQDSWTDIGQWQDYKSALKYLER